jgi:hypothetical protein
MKKKSNGFGRLALLAMLCSLTACALGSREESASLAASVLYQPPTLRLKAGHPVQTPDGIYTPQRDETWHSDARFRQLEQENIDLAAALRAKQ